MSHSMPTNVPLVPGIDNVPRTPRTPRGTIIDRQDPRFYPVVKDGTKPDPQVGVIMAFIIHFSVVSSSKMSRHQTHERNNSFTVTSPCLITFVNQI